MVTLIITELPVLHAIARQIIMQGHQWSKDICEAVIHASQLGVGHMVTEAITGVSKRGIPFNCQAIPQWTGNPPIPHLPPSTPTAVFWAHNAPGPQAQRLGRPMLRISRSSPSWRIGLSTLIKITFVVTGDTNSPSSLLSSSSMGWPPYFTLKECRLKPLLARPASMNKLHRYSSALFTRILLKSRPINPCTQSEHDIHANSLLLQLRVTF